MKYSYATNRKPCCFSTLQIPNMTYVYAFHLSQHLFQSKENKLLYIASLETIR